MSAEVVSLAYEDTLRLHGRCLCGVTLKLARKRWWEHGECGYLPKCRACRKRGPLVMYRLKRGWFRARICYQCWKDEGLRRTEQNTEYARRFKFKRRAAVRAGSGVDCPLTAVREKGSAEGARTGNSAGADARPSK